MFYKKVFGPFHPQANKKFLIKTKKNEKLKFRENHRRKITKNIKKVNFFYF
jgi:hypothetical protein